jgi:DNA-binding transcriptional regulator YdaS (Cro superfamily)
MSLKTFIRELPDDDMRRDFAARCGTTIGHLRNVMYGQRQCSAELAVAIERESLRRVTRPELCPETWRHIWPELHAQTLANQPTR